jgi:class 3 adenylate cyclase
MAEPRVQYCTAPDGVSLAFCAEGTGAPLFLLPSTAAFGHLQIEALFPETRRALDYLTPRMNIIRYDRRGHGLSDPDISDDSLQAHVGDLLAIIDRLAIERVALYARVLQGPLAIAFAHQYPERVSHLILGATTPSDASVFETDRFRALTVLLEHDWELYTSLVALMLAGWSAPDVANRLVAQMRAVTTPERVRLAREAIRRWDATALMPAVRVPTLVMNYPVGFLPSDYLVRRAREMAGAIPGAQLLTLDDEEQAARAACEFVTGMEATPLRRTAELPEGTAIILFADIVDSTALTEQLGDAVYRKRASRLDAMMRSGIRDCGGTPIEGKVLGDGVMAAFAAARNAIDAALRCRAAADGTGLALHLGIHAGDVTREGGNVYGGAVNIASRVCGLSEPGEILVSATVRELARTSAGVSFEDRGDREMKGVADPVRVYAVRSPENP